MNFCACSSTMVSSSSGTAAAAASSSFGGYWNRLQILVVMVWKPAGNARIARDQRRQRQRNCDAPCRSPRLAAEDGGRVFQFAGHVIQRVRHQHEYKGKR